MYCVIQKIINKKPDMNGSPKELKAGFFTSTINGHTKTRYTYSYSMDRFERPIKIAYKISIHKSYRKDGKVKKKQWVICTVGYYDLFKFWPGDFLLQSTLEEKLKDMGITEEQLWEMVDEKLDPLIKEIKAEFELTEEYKTKKKNAAILESYRNDKAAFEENYGPDTYDYCYDVFGTLRNEEYLEQVKEQRKAQEEYQKRSYYNSYQSNYSDYSFLSSNQSSYTDEEKAMLKKIYRVASKNFHPDVTKDNDDSIMKFLTKLKEQWGI